MKLFRQIAWMLLIAFVILMIGCLSGCKTRKVQTDITSVKKSEVTSQQSKVHKRDTSEAVDTTKKTIESHTEAKNEATSDTQFKADSAVTTTRSDGSSKTTFYINGNVTQHSANTYHKTSSKKSDIKNGLSSTRSTHIDSIGQKRTQLKIDSAKKTKSTDAKGSGASWALYGSIAAVIIAVVGLWLIFGRKKS